MQQYPTATLIHRLDFGTSGLMLLALQKTCVQSGKPVTSRYQVLNYDPDNNTSHVQFEPITGRTHLLRLHSMAIGHPIIGCDLYDLKYSFFKAERLMLHAMSLTFSHPKSNEIMHFSSPSPF